MFEIENLKTLVNLAYVPKVISAFGPAGEKAVTVLLDSVRLLFQRMPPEALQGPLTVIRGIETPPSTPLIGRWGEIERLAGYQELGNRLARAQAGNFLCVEIFADGSLGMLERGEDIDFVAMAAEAVVYRYEARSDRILAKEHDVLVPKVSSIVSADGTRSC
jgi:hypothetical protein